MCTIVTSLFINHSKKIKVIQKSFLVLNLLRFLRIKLLHQRCWIKKMFVYIVEFGQLITLTHLKDQPVLDFRIVNFQ